MVTFRWTNTKLMVNYAEEKEKAVEVEEKLDEISEKIIEENL